MKKFIISFAAFVIVGVFGGVVWVAQAEEGTLEEENMLEDREPTEEEEAEYQAYIEYMESFEFVGISVEDPETLNEYEEFYIEENIYDVQGSDYNTVDHVGFEYTDEENLINYDISIYSKEILIITDDYFGYDPIEDFKNSYPDIWEIVLKKNKENIQAEEERMRKFGDIYDCLNVIDTEKDEEGNLIEVTFFCNTDRNLVIDDPEIINDFRETGEWDFRYENNLYKEYNSDYLQLLENGGLVTLQTDEDGNYTYFTIVDFDTDEVMSGEYYEDNGLRAFTFFMLGEYIIKNPDEWQKKLDWYENESANYIINNPRALRGDDYRAWMNQYSAEEQYELDLVPFKDTPDSAWYTGFVGSLKWDGIVSGYKDEQGNETGYFHPEDEVTYGEFLKMSLNIFGLGEKIQQAEAPYWDNNEVDDISGDGYEYHWALKFYKIAKFLNTRVVNEPGFDLNKPISRKQVVGLIKDLIGYQLPDESIVEIKSTCFDDLDINDKYSQEICYLKQLHLIDGNDDGTFKPDTGINRAEVAKILVVIADYIGNPIYADYVDEDEGICNEASTACTTCADCITFIEFLKKIIEKTGTPIDTSGNPTFEYISQDDENYKYMATAYNMGLVENEIAVFDRIARATAARILVELLNLQDTGEDVSLCEDVSEEDWFAFYVKIFAQHGIYSENMFYPADLLTYPELEGWLNNINL